MCHRTSECADGAEILAWVLLCRCRHRLRRRSGHERSRPVRARPTPGGRTDRSGPGRFMPCRLRFPEQQYGVTDSDPIDRQQRSARDHEGRAERVPHHFGQAGRGRGRAPATSRTQRQAVVFLMPSSAAGSVRGQLAAQVPSVCRRRKSAYTLSRGPYRSAMSHHGGPAPNRPPGRPRTGSRTGPRAGPRAAVQTAVRSTGIHSSASARDASCDSRVRRISGPGRLR